MKILGGEKWTRSDLLALFSLGVTLVGCFAAIFSIPGISPLLFRTPEKTSQLTQTSSLDQKTASASLASERPLHTLTPGIWIGSPAARSLDFGPADGCRYRLSITDPAMELEMDNQGQVHSGRIHYIYNERWIVEIGKSCTSNVPVNSYNLLNLSWSNDSRDEIHITFDGKGSTQPGAIARFDGRFNQDSSSITGNLKLIRNDLTEREEAWIWEINLPVTLSLRQP